MSIKQPTLSQLGVTSREGGGSSYSGGDDAHWAPEGRSATSYSLFDAREVGLAQVRECCWAEFGSPPRLLLVFSSEEGAQRVVTASVRVVKVN
ncbi:hypothetical protein CVT26_004560 [Gymnopilus dilepis]|uniref:Uncharacterized protein n=1 Tax=Gymnopilus dilepis TaxID=231916 RepID=A0A409YJ97_9AGAR|nr:hypothetical protein CVT26_004560 [Gymnopilus dilepis]